MTAQDTSLPPHLPPWDREHLLPALATAARYARSGARRLSLSASDRDDLQQDILLILLERSAQFAPERGSWSTFVTVLARRAVIDRARRPAESRLLSLNTPEGQRLAQMVPASDDQRHAVEFGIAFDALPDEPRALLRDIIQHTDLLAARDSCGASPASIDILMTFGQPRSTFEVIDQVIRPRNTGTLLELAQLDLNTVTVAASIARFLCGLRASGTHQERMS